MAINLTELEVDKFLNIIKKKMSYALPFYYVTEVKTDDNLDKIKELINGNLNIETSEVDRTTIVTFIKEVLRAPRVDIEEPERKRKKEEMKRAVEEEMKRAVEAEATGAVGKVVVKTQEGGKKKQKKSKKSKKHKKRKTKRR